jgi:hypothetical protein
VVNKKLVIFAVSIMVLSGTVGAANTKTGGTGVVISSSPAPEVVQPITNVRAEAVAHCRQLFPESAAMRKFCVEEEIKDAAAFARIEARSRSNGNFRRAIRHCRDLARSDEDGTISYSIALTCAQGEVEALSEGY